MRETGWDRGADLSRLRRSRGAGAQAIAAARAGHDAAAQALSGAIVGSTLQDLLGYETLAAARSDLSQPREPREELLLMRTTLLSYATVHALTNTTHGLSGFNRHGTAHGRVEQFGETQMLEAVMLVSGWLRECAFRHDSPTAPRVMWPEGVGVPMPAGRARWQCGSGLPSAGAG